MSCAAETANAKRSFPRHDYLFTWSRKSILKPVSVLAQISLNLHFSSLDAYGFLDRMCVYWSVSSEFFC